jgi:hypothetical protein
VVAELKNLTKCNDDKDYHLLIRCFFLYVDLKTKFIMKTEFKGTKGDFKEDLGIDLLGYNDELMQIIIFSKEVNTHNVDHVFGLSQE